MEAYFWWITSKEAYYNNLHVQSLFLDDCLLNKLSYNFISIPTYFLMQSKYLHFRLINQQEKTLKKWNEKLRALRTCYIYWGEVEDSEC